MNETMNMYPKQHNDVASRVIDEEAIILTPNTGILHTLNPVGTRIWELANGKRTVSGIIQKIKDEFDADEKRIGEDVVDFIESLIHKNMMLLNKKP